MRPSRNSATERAPPALAPGRWIARRPRRPKLRSSVPRGVKRATTNPSPSLPTTVARPSPCTAMSVPATFARALPSNAAAPPAKPRSRSPGRAAAPAGRATRTARARIAARVISAVNARRRSKSRSARQRAGDLGRDLRDLGRGAADPHALRFERFGLRRGGALRARHDRAGVAHRLARRRREARDVGDDRLRDVLGDEVRGLLL